MGAGKDRPMTETVADSGWVPHEFPINYQDSRPLSRMGTGKDRPMTGTVADSGWILHEFTVVKDRLQLLEGISMEQEDQSGLAGVVERVRVNVDALHTNMTSVQAMLSVTDSRMGDFDEKSTVQEDLMAELQHKIDELRADALKAQSESVDATMKGENNAQSESVEATMKGEDNVNQILDQLRLAQSESVDATMKGGKNVNQIWEQIRYIENSLSQRMTLAGTFAQSESVDATMKGENNVNQIWDQIRHVENSLSQRMTLAETSQVNMLQEVDETKETSLDVMARVEELRRHTTALESNLSHVSSKLEDLTRRKQDASNAITMDDVSIAVSRAVDHADRRADNIIKSIGDLLLKEHASTIDSRMEVLQMDMFDSISTKADKDELSTLDTKLAARIAALEGAILKGLKAISDKVSAALSEKLDLSRFNDFKLAARIAALEGAILKGLKAISDKVSASLSEKLDLSRFNDFKLAARIGTLEGAILKGLKAISERVSATLSEKLDLSRFNDFKVLVQVRAVLADVEDRLRDFSPAARGMKVPLDGGGNLGASSCLCCDQRVRSVKDMHASMQSTGQSTTGYGTNSRVFVPERLPSTEGLFPSINKPPDVGAYNNAKMAQQRKQNGSKMAMSRGGFDPYVSQDISEGGYAPLLPWQMSPPDSGTGPREFTKPRSTSGKVGESISGAIAEGRIPNMRGKGGAGGNKELPNPRSISEKARECILGAIAERRIPNMRGKGGAGVDK
eukprot:gene20918-27766_t